MFSVASVTVLLDKVLELASTEAAGGIAQLERPEELRCRLEVWARCSDLMHEIFNADDAKLAQLLLDDAVVRNWDTLLVDLGVSALVDQVPDGLNSGLAVGDVRLDDLKHLRRRFRELDKDTVVNLKQTEQLKSLPGLWWNVGNTSQSNNENHLRLRLHVEVSLRLRESSKTNLLALLCLVLLDVLLSTLEDHLALVLASLCSELVSVPVTAETPILSIHIHRPKRPLQSSPRPQCSMMLAWYKADEQ